MRRRRRRTEHRLGTGLIPAAQTGLSRLHASRGHPTSRADPPPRRLCRGSWASRGGAHPSGRRRQVELNWVTPNRPAVFLDQSAMEAWRTISGTPASALLTGQPAFAVVACSTTRLVEAGRLS